MVVWLKVHAVLKPDLHGYPQSQFLFTLYYFFSLHKNFDSLGLPCKLLIYYVPVGSIQTRNLRALLIGLLAVPFTFDSTLFRRVFFVWRFQFTLLDRESSSCVHLLITILIIWKYRQKTFCQSNIQLQIGICSCNPYT